MVPFSVYVFRFRHSNPSSKTGGGGSRRPRLGHRWHRMRFWVDGVVLEWMTEILNKVRHSFVS